MREPQKVKKKINLEMYFLLSQGNKNKRSYVIIQETGRKTTNYLNCIPDTFKHSNYLCVI